MWQLPTWGSYKIAKPESDETKVAAGLENGDSDTKTLAVPSEKSTGDGELTPAPSNVVEGSSPAITSAA
jgi:hypothetical protein